MLRISATTDQFLTWTSFLNGPGASQLQDYLCTNGLYMGRSSWHTEKNHSTETALLTVHNDIIRGIASHKDVIFILLDLSAAFDTVNHQILLQRLRDRFGICNTALDWFTSYLTDRKHTVGVWCSATEHTLKGAISGKLSVLFKAVKDTSLKFGTLMA